MAMRVALFVLDLLRMLGHHALDSLASSPRFWPVATLAPRLLSGHLIHQAALWAARAGDFPRAERLFESAARRYRAELDLVPLARLRVHQLMARVHATSRDGPDSERCLEVERRLHCLQRIESLAPPFPLVEASSLLATWLGALPAGAGGRGSSGVPPLETARAS